MPGGLDELLGKAEAGHVRERRVVGHVVLVQVVAGAGASKVLRGRARAVELVVMCRKEGALHEHELESAGPSRGWAAVDRENR
eukprot:16099602-Heterocapsa_arctica.AAC.1